MQFEVEFISPGPRQLWAVEPFTVKAWWRQTPLEAEDKGDEWHIGCRYKLDLPVHCWVTWESTSDLVHNLSIIEALTNSPPSPQHALIGDGIHVISFWPVPEPEPAPEPEPTPEPTPEPPPAPLDPSRINCLILARAGSDIPAIAQSYVVGIEPDLFNELLETVREKLIETIGAQMVRSHLKGAGQ